MRTTLDLLNKAVEMGFDRESALLDIDKSLDEEFGYENRKPIDKEELSDELFDNIVLGFKCESDYFKCREHASNSIGSFLENLSSNDIDLDNKLDNMCEIELSFELVDYINKNIKDFKPLIENYIMCHVSEYMDFICESTILLWANGFIKELDLKHGLYQCDALYLEAIEHVLNKREEDKKWIKI